MTGRDADNRGVTPPSAPDSPQGGLDLDWRQTEPGVWRSRSVPCPHRDETPDDYLTAEIRADAEGITWRVDYHESIVDPPHEGERSGDAADLLAAQSAAADAIRELLALG